MNRNVNHFLTKLPTFLLYLDLAIGAHLAFNPDTCGKSYPNESFSILESARTDYHLTVLEAIFINFIKPDLCHQRKFTFHTCIFPNHDLHNQHFSNFSSSDFSLLLRNNYRFSMCANCSLIYYYFRVRVSLRNI